MSGGEPYVGFRLHRDDIFKGYVVTSDADQRFTLLRDDRLLRIETRRAGIETAARFSIDEQQVAGSRNWFEPVTLTHDDLTVDVRSTWLGQVTGCALVRDDGARIPFTPPTGSHAARLDELASEHPVLYASRHVAIALLELGLGLLGIGVIVWAFFGQLLPRLNLPDLVPDIGISLPGFLKTILSIPDRIIEIPIRWIRAWYDRLSENIDLPDWSGLTGTLLSWFQDVRILIPVAIAVVVAIEEVQRRKTRNAPTEPPSPARSEADEGSEADRSVPKTVEASAIDHTDDKSIAAGHAAEPTAAAVAHAKRPTAKAEESGPG